MTGQTISHYQVLEKLGEGGMGTVYKAKDTRLGRLVALKFLSEAVAADNARRSRFLQEARAVASIDHPNVCTIYDLGEAGLDLFIVMGLVLGSDLRSLSAGSPLSVDRALEIGAQVASGLEAAHREGIVHRDIKPSNILADQAGRAVIVDFGVAAFLGETDNGSDKVIVGTPLYMSPEQLLGQPVDQRTDLWSLGVVLFELLTHQSPFRGNYDQALAYAILNEQPEPAPLPEDVPEEAAKRIKRILDTALSKKADERYSCAREMAEELEDARTLARRGGSRWRRPGGDAERPDARRPESVMLAVAPFSALSGDTKSAGFALGLAEDLRTALCRLPRVRLISSPATAQHEAVRDSPAAEGWRAPVAAIVTGSVRRFGNRLRVNVHVVRASDGCFLWSDRFDREAHDSFGTQAEIAEEVASGCGTSILGLPDGMEEGTWASLWGAA